MSETEFIPRRRARDIQFYALKDANGNLVVSKERVKKTAEVYTPLSIVKFMVKSAFEQIYDEKDSKATRYYKEAFTQCLEPCCGHGNFLEYLTQRKFKSLALAWKANNVDFKLMRKTPMPFFYILNVLDSIDAIDILADNVIVSRNRVFLWTNKVFKKIYGRKMPLSLAKIVAYLLRIKIQHNDTLLGEYCFLRMQCDDKGICSYYFIYYKGNVWLKWDTGEKWIETDKPNTFSANFMDMKEIYNKFKQVSNTITTDLSSLNIARLDKNLSRTIAK